MGADTAGRDVFVRVIYGARTSLIVAIGATGIAVVIGMILGLLAGYFGGTVDTIISRGTDIILSVPSLLFAIGIVAVCSTSAQGCLGGLVKPGLTLVIFVIALFTWPYIARIVRGNTLSLREREFIEASRSLGRDPHPDHVPGGAAEPRRADHHLRDAADPDKTSFSRPRSRSSASGFRRAFPRGAA